MYLCIREHKKDALVGKIRIKKFLPKLTIILLNLIRLGPRIILRSSMQLLRANIWLRILSTFTMVIVDIVRYFKGYTSRQQFVLDVVLSFSLLGGGAIGWWAGRSFTTQIIAENAVLLLLSGLIGSGIFGSLGERFARNLLGRYLQSDVERMLNIFEKTFVKLGKEYGFSPAEMQKLSESVWINKKICLDCFRSDNCIQYADDYIRPYFEENGDSKIFA